MSALMVEVKKPTSLIKKKVKKTAYLMKEKPLFLLPKLAAEIGVAEALMLQEIHYALLGGSYGVSGYYAAYMKYSDWKFRLPFYSLRWIKGKLFEFRAAGLIRWTPHNHEQRGRGFLMYFPLKRYNVTSGARSAIPKLYQPGPAIPVFRTLSAALGLVEALVLQQIHFKCRRGTIKNDLRWFGKTFDQWSTDELPCYSPSTFKRAIHNLEARNLLEIKRGLCSDQRVKFYRINYPTLKMFLVNSGISPWSNVDEIVGN